MRQICIAVLSGLLAAWCGTGLISADDAPLSVEVTTHLDGQQPSPDVQRIPVFSLSPATPELDERLQRIERQLQSLESRLESLQQRLDDLPTANATRRGERGFRGLYTANRDGTGAELLIAAPGMLVTSDANWSHNGQRVAMNGMPAVDAFGESHLFVYDLEGPNKGRFIDLGYGATPDWSPDDRQIACMVNAANTGGIEGGLWIMNADGSERRRIGNAWWPRWSPDGSLICAHGWDRGGELNVYEPDTGGVRTVLKAPGWQLLQWGGEWSPDGERIAFMGSFEGRHHLATIHRNGADDSIRIVYSSDPNDRELAGPPFWSPDGRQFLFSMRDAQPSSRWFFRSYLYSMSADIRSAPVLLEGEQRGKINRVVTWSPDQSRIIFSSER